MASLVAFFFAGRKTPAQLTTHRAGFQDATDVVGGQGVRLAQVDDLDIRADTLQGEPSILR
eukprot:1478758-Lingulodinium_polyedra.AAC.1